MTKLNRLRIAIVANDGKKPVMLNWVARHCDELSDMHITSTGNTGRLIHETFGLKVKCLHSGPVGGDHELGAGISRGKFDLVVFFIDPNDVHPHYLVIHSLFPLAAEWDVPIACCTRAADLMLAAMLEERAPYTLL